jgi:hypothetical protein
MSETTGAGAPGRHDLDRLIDAYFTLRRGFERLAVVAAAERLVNVKWKSELLARRSAAHEAVAAARTAMSSAEEASGAGLPASIAAVRLHAAKERWDEVCDTVTEEFHRLHRARRHALAELLAQLQRVAEAKDALRDLSFRSHDGDVARIHRTVRRALVVSHHRHHREGRLAVDDPVVAVATDDTGEVLVHVESEPDARIAEDALLAAGVRVSRDVTYGPSESRGIRLLVRGSSGS